MVGYLYDHSYNNLRLELYSLLIKTRSFPPFVCLQLAMAMRNNKKSIKNYDKNCATDLPHIQIVAIPEMH